MHPIAFRRLPAHRYDQLLLAVDGLAQEGVVLPNHQLHYRAVIGAQGALPNLPGHDSHCGCDLD